MKKVLIPIVPLLLLICSCDSIKEKTKTTINKSGETVGKTATEFIEGVTEGVDKSLKCELSVSEGLIKQGLETGKFSIDDDGNGGENNQLTLYLIFNQDIDTIISVKAFDKNGLEIGRTKLKVNGEAGEAAYYDFKFDSRTYIEVKSKLRIE